MSKMKSLVSTLIAIVMLVSLSVVAQAQGTQSQLTGEITAITPTEGGVVITMLDEEGNSSDVFISEDTAIADLEVGWTVTVTVVQQEDGTFHATAVMVEDDDEDDGECEDCLHPVATQLAEYFGVDYQELVAYHDGGVGFGLLARAYFLANYLAEEGFTVEDILAMKGNDEGFGYFLHEYGIHPGSYSLGAIMSGKGPQWKHTMKEQNSNAFGQDKTPPGQAKKEQTGQEWTPPGQAKNDEGDHNWTPPGQEKKDKGNNGH